MSEEEAPAPTPPKKIRVTYLDMVNWAMSEANRIDAWESGLQEGECLDEGQVRVRAIARAAERVFDFILQNRFAFEQLVKGRQDEDRQTVEKRKHAHRKA